MKKIVVIGGSGFLGSYVCDELIFKSYKTIIGDLRKPVFTQGEFEFRTCDISDINSIRKIIDDDTYAVYNFAGLTDIDDALNRPLEAINLNILGNLNILEVCREKNINRFIYASSAYAFSKKGSFYGISKFASEKLIEEYFTRYGLKYTIIRYGSLYGERADSHNYIYRTLREAIESGVIKHKSDGEEVREYIHAKDAAKLSVDVLEDDKYINEHIVLTGLERLKRKEFLFMIKEILNDKITIQFADEKHEGHYEVTPYSFHPNVAKKLVSNPFIDLGQGLVECIKKIYEELKINENN